MRLLLDSNIIVPLTRRELGKLSARINLLLSADANDLFVSAASLWEIAIKTRLRKLDPEIALNDLPEYLVQLGFDLIPISEHHVVAELVNPPDTRDPFDQLLLAQCQVENLRLVTVDRALAEHPLAWR